jgi:hypothetical protein
MGIDELRSEYPEAFEEITLEIVDEFGVDLLDPSALREFGLDPGAPIHIGAIGDPTPAIFVLLPAEKDAEAFLANALKRDADAYPLKSKKAGTDVYSDAEQEMAFFTRGSYIVLILTGDEDDDVPALEAAQRFLELSDKKNLSGSKDYKNAMKKVTGDADMTFYVGPELYKEMIDLSDDDDLPDHQIEPDELIDLYERWGMLNTTAAGKMTLGTDRITAEAYSWLQKDSDIREWYQIQNDPTAFLNRLPSDPMLIALGRTNVSAIWNSIDDFYEVVDDDDFPQLDDEIEELDEDFGLDLENNLIKKLDGNFGLLLNGVDFTGVDAVMLLQVSDPKTFGSTLTELVEEIDESITIRDTSDPNAPQTELMREEFKGVPYYRLVKPPNLDLSFGVIEDHFIVSPSVTRFQSIVTGDGSFLDKIGNEDVRKALKDRTGGVFYVDFDAVADNLEQMAPLFGPDAFEIVELLRELDELVSTSSFDGDGIFQKTTITSSKPGIWKRLIALALEDYEKDLAAPEEDDPEDDEED